MDDFLHNLRSGKNKPFDRNRRPYINPQFRDTEWRNGNDNKKGGYRKNNQPENMAGIKSLLENISKNQERFAVAEERVADAIERIADALTHFGLPKVSATESREHIPAPDATETTEIEPVKPDHVDRHGIVDIVLEMRKDGNTYGKIAQYIESKQIPTFSGKGQWCAQTVHRLHKQHMQSEAGKEG